MKHITVSILLISLSQFVYAQTGEYFFEKAKIKEEQKDYQYASILIDKAIQLDDTNIWYWLKKAEIQLNTKEPYLAIKYIKRAISIDSTKSEPYNRGGTFYESRGLIDSSIYMYNKAIKFAKNDTIRYSYIQNRGNSKAAKRDFEGARIDYELALKFDPNDAGSLNNIASIYRQLGMPNEAIESLKKLISIDSLLIGSYINLGFAYSKLDSLDLAIKYFDRALTLDSNEALVYSNRGYTYYKKENYSKALSDINKSISLYPTNAYAYRNLALVYLSLNSSKEACTALDFAKKYGFTQRYGGEVEELINNHCKK